MIGRGLKGKSILLLAVLTVFSLGSLAFAQGEKEIPRPERGFAIFSEFSGIYAAPGESIRLELTVENKGRTDENILLKISEAPKGWKASLKAPNYTVNAVPVPATKSKTLTFVADPDKGMKPGTYQFKIEAQTQDGKFTSSQTITANVQERSSIAEDITITTSYPVLQGQTDARFEFSL